jgi:hypothetical protein
MLSQAGTTKIHVELSSFQDRGRDGPITFPDGHQPVKLKPRTKIKFFAATEQNSLPTFFFDLRSHQFLSHGSTVSIDLGYLVTSKFII